MSIYNTCPAVWWQLNCYIWNGWLMLLWNGWFNLLCKICSSSLRMNQHRCCTTYSFIIFLDPSPSPTSFTSYVGERGRVLLCVSLMSNLLPVQLHSFYNSHSFIHSIHLFIHSTPFFIHSCPSFIRLLTILSFVGIHCWSFCIFLVFIYIFILLLSTYLCIPMYNKSKPTFNTSWSKWENWKNRWMTVAPLHCPREDAGKRKIDVCRCEK